LPRRPARWWPRHPVRWAVLLVVVAVLAVFLGTAVRIWWVARQDARPRSDAIVVLGASQYNGRPSSWFEARLDHAKTLYEQGIAPRIVTVGGNQPGDEFTEAGSGRRWLVDHGLPAAAVVALETGRDTLESIKAVDRLFESNGWKSAVIVTDPWHSYRSRAIARDLGIDAATSPTRQGPAVRQRGTQVTQILRETVAYWDYRLFD
jgi:vancomycin permeability regulator SanA